jgi:Tfp pilus assembly protein PilO
MKKNPAKLDLSHPEEWPVVYKLIAMLFTLIVVICLGYFIFVSSHQTKLNKNRAYYVSMQEKFTKSYGKFHKVRQLEINVNDNQDQIKKSINQLQSNATATDVNTAIQQAANQSGITIRSFKSDITQTHSNFTLTPLDLVAKASYHQAATFISLIANLPHVVIIGDFKLAQPVKTKNGQLDFTITLKLYQPKELLHDKQ